MRLATSIAGNKAFGIRRVSLNGIAATALSALKTSSAALGVTSNNVANVNTPGYARRVVNQQTLAAGGQLMGVDATTKLAEEHAGAWPERLAMSQEAVDLVRGRWSEYGLPTC